MGGFAACVSGAECGVGVAALGSCAEVGTRVGGVGVSDPAGGVAIGGRGTGLAEGVVGSLAFTDGFADGGRGTLCSAAAPDSGVAGRLGAEFGDLFACAGGRFSLFADDGVGGVPGFAVFAGTPAAGFAAGG